ncbi:hypothetical protein [Rhodovulum adriaticum]|uniref:Uncharacterized protein n=1 Tax=Rhodovulum adriaticum TaxID=35804 RepID=A0A4V2SMH3_RHOAD|nr:hypothetical protein [Rhodovulum adriaticum]MBK1634155.1 hypothetical protein [Rhodovulum adriaticum]TCP27296.1 hypothetical protein EV656_101199 [Rhodovulum adriaticum]
MHHNTQTEPLEEMAASALRLGRNVVAMVRDLRPGADSHDAAFLQRCLAPLGDSRVFSRRYDGGFDTALTRLRALRDGEEIYRRRDFRGFLDPEGDDVGIVCETPVYTDRGDQLAALVEHLEAVIATRQSLFDRQAAERFLLGRT